MEEKKIGAALVRKVADVMKAVGAVPKSGKNQHFGYSFRRHEDIMNKLQPALCEAGLVIIPTEKRTIAAEPGYVLLEATYEITDGEQAIVFKGIGEGADKSRDGRPGDKAAYKAQTGAMKYALNDLLQLPGEDPENDTTTHGGKDGKGNPDPNKPPANKPPANKPATGKQAPTDKPQAKAAEHKLTDEQRSELIDLMNKLNYEFKKIELGIQKARVVGFESAKATLAGMVKAQEETAGASK